MQLQAGQGRKPQWQLSY